MAADTATSYHHGDLHNQLRLVAAEVIAERGAAGFSLREVARRAGVSHAAPAHHYGDATGLLTAVAIDAFRHLGAAIAVATEGIDDPVARLKAMGRAYVTVSTAHPGHCAVVFRHDLIDTTDEEYRREARTAHLMFRDAVAEVADTLNPDLDVDNASRLGWAALQGLVQLHPNMVAAAEHDEGVVPERGDLAEIFITMMIDGVRPSR